MMHFGHPRRDKVTLFLGDIALIAITAIAGWYSHLEGGGSALQRWMSLLVLLPTFSGILYILDLYSLSRLNGFGTLVKVVLAVGSASVLSYVLFHLFQWQNPTYLSVKLCALILPPAAYAWRRAYFHSSRRFLLPKKLLVVGTARDGEILSSAIDTINPRYTLLGVLCAGSSKWPARQNQADLRISPQWDVTAVGVPQTSSYASASGTAVALAREMTPSERIPKLSSDSRAKVPDLGPASCENLLKVAAERGVEVIAVRTDAMTFELASVLTRIRFNGIQVYSLLEFCMTASEELPLEMLDEFWLAVADGFDLLQARIFRRMKRLSDIFLATIALLLSLPLMLLVAIVIRLDSRGPALFRQQRVGWMGRPFELLKFRSMQVDAENDGGPQWAALDDSRVTTVGNILRKTHFDELPQMINILRGEMSFVGPRPERPEFVGILSESIKFYHLRHYVLPGITGWAQVNYRYGASIDDARRKLQYDLYYVCHASPLLDLRIMLRTVRVVLFGNGSR
jgi:lipopolysaccharide/colanic/teichoic acid biosynthesis glycosyltransferase